MFYGTLAWIGVKLELETNSAGSRFVVLGKFMCRFAWENFFSSCNAWSFIYSEDALKQDRGVDSGVEQRDL